MSYVLAICASGLLGGWPVLAGLLEESGLFMSMCPKSANGVSITAYCSEQGLHISQIYTVGHGVLTFSYVFIGAIFDRWGGRTTCIVGGVSQVTGIVLVIVALLSTRRDLLLTEQVLMYLGTILCDVGMVCIRFATISFQWYFPKSRGFVMGLANSASACSTLVVIFIKVGHKHSGAPLWKCFVVYAAIIATATVGLSFTVPSQVEFLGEAERVNGYRSETTRNDSTWRWVCRGVKVIWMTPYRWLNMIFVVAWTSYLCAVIFTFSNMFFYFRALFDSHSMAEVYAILYSWLQLINTGFLGGFYGLISDYYGLGCFTMSMFFLNAVQFATVLINHHGAQVLQLFAGTLCWSLTGNYVWQYSSFYIPPNLQGVFAGITAFVAGTCQIIFVSLAHHIAFRQFDGAMVYKVPMAIFGPISILFYGLQAYAVMKIGVPEVPPKEDSGEPTQKTPLLLDKAP